MRSLATLKKKIREQRCALRRTLEMRNYYRRRYEALLAANRVLQQACNLSTER